MNALNVSGLYSNRRAFKLKKPLKKKQ